MILDILRGSRQARILQQGLDRISSYGVLRGTGAGTLRIVLDHLLARGMVRLTGGEYPVLQCGPVTLEQGDCLAVKIPREEKPALSRAGIGAGGPMLEALKQLRRRLAAAQGVPAYVVFTDAALADMCARQPATPAEFLEVSGVGQAKLERYGEAFLREIRRFAGEGEAAHAHRG